MKEETVFSRGDMESDAQSSGKFSLMSFSSYTTLSNCDTGFPCVSSFILGVVVALGWEEIEFIKPRMANLEEIRSQSFPSSKLVVRTLASLFKLSLSVFKVVFSKVKLKIFSPL